MLLDISNIIDENWLSATLGIVFSLFLFLLGIPTVFFQTFLPEDIRHIYNKRIGRKEKAVIIYLTVVVVLFAVSVNHGIKYWLQSMLANNGLNQNDKTQIQNYFIGYYFFVLCAFVVFIVIANRIFLKTFFVKDNIRKKLIDQIVADAKEYYLKFKVFSNEDIQDLTTIGKTSPDGINKGYILEGIKKLSEFVLGNDNKDPETKTNTIRRLLLRLNSSKKCAVCSYDGEKLFDLIETVLFETVCKSSSNANEKNFKEALEICNMVRSNQQPHFTVIDQRSLSNFLTKLSFIALDHGYHEVVKDALDLLYKLPNQEKNLYEINHKVYEMGELVFISTAINKAYVRLHNYSSTHLPQNKTVIIHNLIAYFSWLFFFNDQTRQFVVNSIGKFLHEQILSKPDFDKSRQYFYTIGEYKTAQHIQDMNNTMFNQPAQLQLL